MVEARVNELVPESPEQEFGLVGGPLGHLADEPLHEAYFNASLWEAVPRTKTAPGPDESKSHPEKELALQL